MFALSAFPNEWKACSVLTGILLWWCPWVIFAGSSLDSCSYSFIFLLLFLPPTEYFWKRAGIQMKTADLFLLCVEMLQEVGQEAQSQVDNLTFRAHLQEKQISGHTGWSRTCWGAERDSCYQRRHVWGYLGCAGVKDWGCAKVIAFLPDSFSFISVFQRLYH